MLRKAGLERNAQVCEFDNGAVLANPGLHDVTIDLGTRLPGQRFRRLRATWYQDLKTNSGTAVTRRKTFPP